MLSFCLLLWFTLIVEQALALRCHYSSLIPYDLSLSPTLSVESEQFPGGKYYIQPCGIVDPSLCGMDSSQQQCFAITTGETFSDGLGSETMTQWWVDPQHPENGIIAVNTEFVHDYAQCIDDPARNLFNVSYVCHLGTDLVTIISEPSADKSGACIFEFLVDSSVICNWIDSSSSSGMSSSSSSSNPMISSTSSSPCQAPSSSSTGLIQPAAPQCWMVAPSYRLPFDLSTTPTLSIASPTFSGATYHIQPCGWVPDNKCSAPGAHPQQCIEYRGVGVPFGDPTLTQWSQVNPYDITHGVMSSNIDIGDSFHCDATSELNMFKVTYKCIDGTDNITVIGEPNINMTSHCRFEFLVDSSAFCKWLHSDCPYPFEEAEHSHQAINQPISQAFNPPRNQPINQHINQHVDLPINQPHAYEDLLNTQVIFISSGAVDVAFLFVGILVSACVYFLWKHIQLRQSINQSNTHSFAGHHIDKKMKSEYPHELVDGAYGDTLL